MFLNGGLPSIGQQMMRLAASTLGSGCCQGPYRSSGVESELSVPFCNQGREEFVTEDINVDRSQCRCLSVCACAKTCLIFRRWFIGACPFSMWVRHTPALSPDDHISRYVFRPKSCFGLPQIVWQAVSGCWYHTSTTASHPPQAPAVWADGYSAEPVNLVQSSRPWGLPTWSRSVNDLLAGREMVPDDRYDPPMGFGRRQSW